MNSKKILAAAVSVAAIASLTACGGVKDDTTAGADSGNAITIGTKNDRVSRVLRHEAAEPHGGGVGHRGRNARRR